MMDINDILILIFISAIITAILVYIFYRGIKHILQSLRHQFFPARYLKKFVPAQTSKNVPKQQTEHVNSAGVNAKS